MLLGCKEQQTNTHLPRLSHNHEAHTALHFTGPFREVVGLGQNYWDPNKPITFGFVHGDVGVECAHSFTLKQYKWGTVLGV